MLLRSPSVEARLKEKVRRTVHDASRHLRCPECRSRLRLHTLSDGRKKCGSCGKKFSIRRMSDSPRIRRFADLILCFAFDFPAQQAAVVTGYPYRTVAAVYRRLRASIAEKSAHTSPIRLLLATEPRDRSIHDSDFCRRCRLRYGCAGRKAGNAPVFGLRFVKGGNVRLDALEDTAAPFRPDSPSLPDDGRFNGYAGFICNGHFHRFSGGHAMHDGAEQVWSWMHARLSRHHGIRSDNTGLYLKELEWRYNNRMLDPESIALKIAEALPDDFLRPARVR